jgi:hypothetical protein
MVSASPTIRIHIVVYPTLIEGLGPFPIVDTTMWTMPSTRHGGIVG